jgi:hypothetical protein
MSAIETIEYKGYTIKTYQDEDAESPREWDNLGTMTCFHDRYNLGDKHNMAVEELIETAKRPDVIALPLVLLDHSGLWMRVGRSFREDPGGWDTSRVGYIWVDYATIRKEYNIKHITDKIKEKVRGILENEVKTYSDYLEGNVYGYNVEDSDGDIHDSCWGYFGDNGYKDMIAQVKNSIDYNVPDDLYKQVFTTQLELFV